MFRKSIFIFLTLVHVCIGGVIPEINNISSVNGWTGRMVGGTPAELAQFPWQVSLRNTLDVHFCGGSIVNSRWVLTAAHCTINAITNTVRIIVGAISQKSGGTTHICIKIINHPHYNKNLIRNDVAVLQTASPIMFSSTVSIIPLGSSNIQIVNAQVSGWGRPSRFGTMATDLLFINLQTITNNDCRERYVGENKKLIFDESLCAAVVKGTGVCYTNGGDPMVTGGQQIGIVSWGIPCDVGFPDVYARVSSFRSWIIQQTT